MGSLTLIFTLSVEPNGLMGCKVPTDLVKISVKEAMHMGFYYILTLDYRKIGSYFTNKD